MIKFIREYMFYGRKMFDVIYYRDGHLSRVISHREEYMPKTAQAFLAKATPTQQYDNVYKRDTIIYK